MEKTLKKYICEQLELLADMSKNISLDAEGLFRVTTAMVSLIDFVVTVRRNDPDALDYCFSVNGNEQ